MDLLATARVWEPATPNPARGRSCVYGRGMSWEIVLTSAAISTVVSAVVTLLLAGRVAVRQRRAEAAEAGLVTLRGIVAPWRLELTQFGLGMANSLRRNISTSHAEDHGYATQVMSTAQELRRIRRWLVRRRCRRVFGAYWTTLAEQMPWDGEPDTYPLTAHLTNALAADSWGAHRLNALSSAWGAPALDVTTSLYQRAYTARPGDELQRKLARQLLLLAAGR